jgi:hypothetical protein
MRKNYRTLLPCLTLTFLCIALMPIYASAQADTALSYHNIVTVDSASKDQLFIRARQWMNKTFVSSKAVLQIADKESGELAGKGNMEIVTKYRLMGRERDQPYRSNFSCNIWVKDGKYKFEFKDFEVETIGEGFSFGILTSSDETKTKYPMVSKAKMNDSYKQAKLANEEKVMELIRSLREAMETKEPSDF